MHNAPIGMIDSGSGGLSIWGSVVELLPDESVVYVGDHAYVPYSTRSQKEIRERVGRLIHFLVDRGVTLVVVACNTATVAGIEHYRRRFPKIPIIGVVPVVKTAAQITKVRRFGVLATEFTAKSAYQKDLVTRFAADCVVYTMGCTSLVASIEQGVVGGRDIREQIRKKVTPALRAGIDVLALGCTHYPFLKREIRAIVGTGVIILDSGGAVARHVRRILKHNGTLSATAAVSYEFFTTGNAETVSTVATKLLKRPIQFRHADI